MTFAHYKKSVHYFKRGQNFAHIYQLFRGNSSVWHESNVPQMKSDRYQLISRHKKKNQSSPILMNRVFRYIEIQLTSEAEMIQTKDTGEQFDHFVS